MPVKGTITSGDLRQLEIESTNAFLTGLQSMTAPMFERLSTTISMNTKTVEAPILSQIGALREWVGPRLVERFARDAYSITAKEFEKTIGIPRTAIEDDNVGLWMPQIGTLGQQAAAWPDQQVFAKLGKGFADLCVDGKPFFSTQHPDGKGGTYSNTDSANGTAGTAPTWYLFDLSKMLKPLIWALRKAPEFTAFWDLKDPNVFWHKEYISGVYARGVADYGFPMHAYAVRGGLTATTFENAVKAMQKLTNAVGENMNVSPTLAVIPSDLKPDADRLWGAELTIMQGSGAANVAVGTVTNTKFKAIEYVVAQRLSNSNDATLAV